MDEDIQFTFDADAILEPLNKVIKRFNDLANVVEATEKRTTDSERKTKNETNAVAMSAKKGGSTVNESLKGRIKETNALTVATQKGGFLMNASLTKLVAVWGLMKGAIGAAKSALMGMPEIGMTFKHAGDIFMRNFLQPIRQFLIPILNKFLAWVSQSRGMFVEWGSIVLNVIEAIIGIVTQFIEMLTVAFDTFSDTLKSVFGEFNQSFGDMMRLLITKVAATIFFIMALLKPLFEVIGRIFAFVVIGVKGLLSGISKQAVFLIGAIRGLIDAIVEFFDILMGGEGDAKAFFGFMEKIGEAIAVIFGVAIKAITVIVKWIGQFIAGFKEGLSLVDGIGDAFDGLIQVFKELGEAIGLMGEEGSIFMDILRGIGKVVGFLLGLFIKFIIKALTVFFKIVKWLIINIPKLINLIRTGLASAFMAMVSAVADAIMAIKNFFKPIKEIFDKIGNFFGGIWDTFTEEASKAFKYVEGLAKSLFNWISKLWKKVTGFFEDSEETSKSIEKTQKRLGEAPIKIVPTVGLGAAKTTVKNEFNTSQNNVINITESKSPRETGEAVRTALSEWEKDAMRARTEHEMQTK